MQRDMDLVRAILLKLEECPHAFAPNPFEIKGFTKEQVGYHAVLMQQAGLIEAFKATAISDPSPSAIPLSLTWEGYEFLATAKNESTWRKGTSAVFAKAGAVGFELLKAVLTAELRKQIGL
jgi:hypothetical protein